MSDSAARPDADEEWNALLRQWRNQSAAQPRPYFYGRVRARLADAAALERLPVRTWLRWPAYAVMLGILLLFSGDNAAFEAVAGTKQESSWPAADFNQAP
ncbi:hypothetical protein [Hymenobacter actinosclerus]|uniref:Uncharacterized protein n=1 Tax=Hymenobacter actinosclerus TaxID=82805 RepID=A0A1I0AFB0_9BACT|nr:hypothetical protein [Hymenobacter actinosclerus]SES92505.1 hypothetical protein SAMN04487998_0688 [Hymenobacter actinosclerus]